jgi:hypothetical protein
MSLDPSGTLSLAGSLYVNGGSFGLKVASNIEVSFQFGRTGLSYPIIWTQFIDVSSTLLQWYQSTTGSTVMSLDPSGNLVIVGGLTIATATGGVLKATAGVIAGSATLDDVGEGTIYKRVTATIYGYLSNANAQLASLYTTTAPSFAGLTSTAILTVNVSGSGAVLKLYNPANTFYYTLTTGAIAASYVLNLPVITAADTLVTLGLAQTFTGALTFNGALAGTHGQSIGTGDSPNFAGLTLTAFSGFVKATAGVLSAAALIASDIPSLAASKITSGTFGTSYLDLSALAQNIAFTSTQTVDGVDISALLLKTTKVTDLGTIWDKTTKIAYGDTSFADQYLTQASNPLFGCVSLVTGDYYILKTGTILKLGSLGSFAFFTGSISLMVLDNSGNLTVLGYVQPLGGYNAADGTAGVTFAASPIKSLTVKNGLVVAHT